AAWPCGPRRVAPRRNRKKNRIGHPPRWLPSLAPPDHRITPPRGSRNLLSPARQIKRLRSDAPRLSHRIRLREAEPPPRPTGIDAERRPPRRRCCPFARAREKSRRFDASNARRRRSRLAASWRAFLAQAASPEPRGRPPSFRPQFPPARAAPKDPARVRRPRDTRRANAPEDFRRSLLRAHAHRRRQRSLAKIPLPARFRRFARRPRRAAATNRARAFSCRWCETHWRW